MWLAHAVEPVETALTTVTREGTGSWMRFGVLAAVSIAALILGLMSLVYYEQWMTGAKSAGAGPPHGPGAAGIAEFTAAPASDTAIVGRRLAMLIAVGIGLHNFSEGLAIGQSAAAGEISLAVLLIVGFGLHNATEGFGIVAPLAGEPNRPSWGFLALLGVIGGGPTLVGTLVGQSFVNDTVSIAFLAAAAGSILYVIVQLLRVAQNLGRRTLMYWGLAARPAARLRHRLRHRGRRGVGPPTSPFAPAYADHECSDRSITDSRCSARTAEDSVAVAAHVGRSSGPWRSGPLRPVASRHPVPTQFTTVRSRGAASACGCLQRRSANAQRPVGTVWSAVQTG